MKFIKKLKKFTLTPEEKNASRNALLSHMERFPFERTLEPRQNFSFFSLFSNRYAAAALIAVLAIGLGSSVCYAAESAVPGDILYPIKINVTEKVLTATSLTPKTKAVWEEKRAERRLEEAEKLSAKGKLDKNKADLLARELKLNIQSARKNEKTQASPTADPKKEKLLRPSFEQKLKAHNRILLKLDEKAKEKEKSNDDLDSILDVVTENVSTAVDSVEDLEKEIKDDGFLRRDEKNEKRSNKDEKTVREERETKEKRSKNDSFHNPVKFLLTD